METQSKINLGSKSLVIDNGTDIIIDKSTFKENEIQSTSSLFNSINNDLSRWYYNFKFIGKGSYSDVFSSFCRVTNIQVRFIK